MILRSGLLAVVLLFCFNANVISGESVGTKFYTINHNGWNQQIEKNGALYSCSSCDSMITVDIIMGDSLPSGVKYRENSALMRSLESKKNQDEFAAVVLAQTFPKNGPLKYKVNRTGISRIGGIQVFQIALTTTSDNMSSRSNLMMAVHKAKPIFISTTFRDGYLTKKDSDKMNLLLSTLKFK